MSRAAAVGFCVLLALRGAVAGDEVDYDAPYLVVENGQLVTRYPPKAHAPGGPAAAAEQAAADDRGSPGAWLGLLPGVALVLALLVRARRRRSRIAGGVPPPRQRGGDRRQ